ncbi:hypothetical protein Tco_0825866 [Tanacetum coccineum]
MTCSNRCSPPTHLFTTLSRNGEQSILDYIIPETESDEFIKSSVEDLVPTPIESEELSDGRSKLDDEVFDSINSIPPGIDPFDAESDLLESMLNRDISIDSSPKIDSLLDEFAGELTFLDSIPPGIDKASFDPEEKIWFVEGLLYDNSSPRPRKDFNSIVFTLSPSPILVQIVTSLLGIEIDNFLAPDDLITPVLRVNDFDSENDDNSNSTPEFRSFMFLNRQMEWGLRSWVEVVKPLQVKYYQLSEPNTCDQNDSRFLLSLSLLCQIPLVFYEIVDRLSKFFPHPFSIINVGSINNTLEDL